MEISVLFPMGTKFKTDIKKIVGQLNDGRGEIPKQHRRAVDALSIHRTPPISFGEPL